MATGHYVTHEGNYANYLARIQREAIRGWVRELEYWHSKQAKGTK